MIRFIRCISRTHLTRDDRDRILHFAEKDVHWGHQAVLADWDGVAGFLYHNMKRLDLLHLFPEPALGELKDIYTHTRKRSLAILSEAEALSLALERAGIQAVALQGLSLITTVYKEPGLLIPDPFDNLVALAAHALKHSYSRMIWLVDIHESLLRWAGGPDGRGRVVERPQSWSQEKILLYALILLERIFALKIPYRVKYELGIDSLGILEKHLLSLSLRGFKSKELCYALWLYNIKGAGNKIRFLKETVFPRDEAMAQIFDHGSGQIRAAGFAKRFGKATAVMGRGLYQALHLSFRSTGNE